MISGLLQSSAQQQAIGQTLVYVYFYGCFLSHYCLINFLSFVSTFFCLRMSTEISISFNIIQYVYLALYYTICLVLQSPISTRFLIIRVYQIKNYCRYVKQHTLTSICFHFFSSLFFLYYEFIIPKIEAVDGERDSVQAEQSRTFDFSCQDNRRSSLRLNSNELGIQSCVKSADVRN